MCPTAERRSAGFTLLELLIVLVIMGVLVAVGAGALSVERNPLYTGAQALVTASSTARSRALLLNAPVTLELGQTFMEISSENGDRPLREAFPKGMSAASVDEHYLLGGSQKLLASGWADCTKSGLLTARTRWLPIYWRRPGKKARRTSGRRNSSTSVRRST